MAAHFEPDWQLDKVFAFNVRSNFTLFTVWLDCSLGQVGHVYTTVRHTRIIFHFSTNPLKCCTAHPQNLMCIPSACPTKRVIHIKDFVAESSKPLQGNFLLCGGGGGWRDVGGRSFKVKVR